jgi:hypothetical protein
VIHDKSYRYVISPGRGDRRQLAAYDHSLPGLEEQQRRDDVRRKSKLVFASPSTRTIGDWLAFLGIDEFIVYTKKQQQQQDHRDKNILSLLEELVLPQKKAG